MEDERGEKGEEIDRGGGEIQSVGVIEDERGEKEEETDRKGMGNSRGEKEDRLSGLPDELRVHILSFMGEDSELSTEEEDEEEDAGDMYSVTVKRAAMSTSLLSNSWQYLWTQLPILKFYQTINLHKIPNFVTFVHTALRNRGQTYLENFTVCFRYNQTLASDVDTWVEYALKCKVGKLVLQLYSKYDVDPDGDEGNDEGKDEEDGDMYTLPHIVYSYSSLRELGLLHVSLSPQARIEWKCLTRLVLEEIELNDSLIENILWGCPVLNYWGMWDCQGFNRVIINTPSVAELLIQGFKNDVGLLEISVPYLQVLHLEVDPFRKQWRLRNTSGVVRAIIDLTFWDIYFWTNGKFRNSHAVFEATMHIPELVMGSKFLEFISREVADGWQIPQSRRQCLTIGCSTYTKVNIFGIIKLLQSSPKLDTLYIHDAKEFLTCDSAENYSQRLIRRVARHLAWNPPVMDDMKIELLQLNNVTMKCSVGTSQSRDLFLMLAKIILKCAKVLKSMTLFIGTEDRSEFDKIAGDVLSYPKSSQHAVIHVS